uniref:CAAX prenyl protease 2 n=1 Tax=Dicentrarchus labrax TaxID=13489 RepID=A0A8C4DGH8_DICLA
MLESEHGPITHEEHAHTRCWVCVLSCLLLACVYVGSLYVWRSSLPRYTTHQQRCDSAVRLTIKLLLYVCVFLCVCRDHPSVIKRRCASVLLVSTLSPAVVKGWIHWADVRVDASVWELMGVRLESLVPAAILPLLLTMVCYLGPLVQSAMDNPKGFTGELQSALDVQSWRLCVGDVVWLRNQVVAPLTEELVFRGAMMPMLVPCTGPTAAIFMAPLFFGVAHFHHIIEQRRLHKDSMSVILLVSGHVVGPVLCHSFCNSQGLPDISSALKHPQQSALVFSYLMGVLLFLVLLFPLTDPFFYGDIPVCSLALPPASVCQMK